MSVWKDKVCVTLCQSQRRVQNNHYTHERKDV